MTEPVRQALVLVDVVPPSPADPDVFQRLRTVLTVARQAGMRVVHVWSAEPGAPPPATDPLVEPVPGEPVLPNPGRGAWSSAGLGPTLATGGVERLVLAGRFDSPGWLPTVEEAAAQPLAVTVLSDRDPAHDLRVRQLLGGSGGELVDPGTWVATAGREVAPRQGTRRRALLLTVLALVVLVLAAGVAVVDHGAKGYYEFAPGSAPTVTTSAACKARAGGSDLTLPDGTPCARLVLPADKVHAVDGRVSMVDVLVGPASPLDYVLGKLHLLDVFRSGHQLVPAAAVLGTTPASQLGCQDAQQMTGATQYAAVAALTTLGYHVKENDLGALVVQVVPGSAAQAAGVECNDLVTAIDGKAVHTDEQLVGDIRGLHPGTRVTITVSRTGANGSPATKTLTATLTGTPAQPSVDGSAAVAAQPTKPFLGVGTQTQLTYSLPFDVSIQVGDIGGPSAGLAFTLGLLDTLSGGRLTGGRPIAATGTIAPDGTVGDVGGVAQKTIAVRRAGAQLFLVPTVEYATAKSKAGSKLEVLPVANLRQALQDLEHLGGTLGPVAAGGTAAPPAAG